MATRKNGQKNSMFYIVRICGEYFTQGDFEERQDGSLWHGPKGDKKPLLSSRAGTSKEELKRLVDSGKFSEIPSAAFLKHGENPGGITVVTRAEERAAEDAKLAAQLCVDVVDVNSKGGLCVYVDVRKPSLGSQMDIRGVKFNAVSTNSISKRGPWRVVRIDLSNPVSNGASPDDVQYWKDLANSAYMDFQQGMDRMMSDENNDGARPPRNKVAAFDAIVKLIDSPLARVVAEIRKAIDRGSAGGVCEVAARYAKRALAVYESGEKNPEALKKIMDECADDEDYREAAWRL